MSHLIDGSFFMDYKNKLFKRQLPLPKERGFSKEH